MQIGRLFGIVYILLFKKTSTAKELADRFEVSTRTIYRDIDILSGSGIPVYANKGKGGGISLVENYVLNKSLLSAKEQDEILSALSCLNSVTFSDTDEVLSKMSGLFDRAPTDWIDIDFTDWSYTRSDTFAMLKTAILGQLVVVFDYYSAMGNASSRSVEPQQLWFKHKAWYLRGYCRLRGEERLFRMSRIRNLKLTGESSQDRPMEANVVESYHAGFQRPPVRLKLRIDQSLSYRVFDEFGDDMYTRDESGNYLVTVEYPEDEWVYGFLLSFGSYLEVLEPPHIREILARRLLETLKYYANI